jgi:putative transcription factor
VSTISECELCGSKATRKAKVEGTVLAVCDDCVRFGEEVKEVEYRKAVKIPQMEGLDTVLVKDFHKTIRRARENKKLTQEELAKKLSEKVSVIKRMEEGWQPSDKLIDKVERFFNIKLREETTELTLKKKTRSQRMTIGDVVEVS